MKDIVKQAHAKLQERVVPDATIKKWAAKIESMAADIEKLVWVRNTILADVYHPSSQGNASYLNG